MMRCALCILAAVLSSAPVVGAAEPAEAPTVHAVVIRGNDQISDADILARIATHPPEGLILVQRYDYDPVAASADRRRIERLYNERGFFGARVDDVHVMNLGAGRVGVRFDVTEGPRAHIASVQTIGLPEGFVPTDRLEFALSRLEEGEGFRHEHYVAARQQLRRALRLRGHAHAQVTGSVRVDRSRTRAFITLRATPGPRVRYGDEVEVVGLERLPESVVRNRIAWEPGDVFSPRKMERTEGRLYELGYFASVRVDIPSDPTEEIVDVEIRATEGARRELQLGGGVALDTAFFETRGRAGFLFRGLGDPLLSARANAQPAYQIQRADPGPGSLGGEASVTFERIDLALPRATGTALVAARSIEFEAYEARGGIVRLGWGFPALSDRLELRGAWEIRPLFQLVNLHPALDPDHDEGADDVIAEIGADVSPYRLGLFEQSLVLDLRDSILAPTRGAYFSLRLQQSGRFAGGRDALAYSSATSELRGYLPIGDRFVVAARGRLGSALTGEIPLTQRYFSGGASDHRGFGSRRLSPTVVADPDEIDEGADPVARFGGDALFETSYELRTRLTRIGDEWLGATVFADGGNVTRDIADIALDDLQWALGAGLRYNTIIGPIRADLAYRITSLPDVGGPVDENRLVFHFSIGEAF